MCNGVESRPNHNERDITYMSSLSGAFSQVGCHLVLVGTCNARSRLSIEFTPLEITVRL